VVDKDGLDLAKLAVGGGQCGLAEFVERGFVAHEGTDLVALADAEVACGVETGALLHEGVDDLEPQCFSQFSQFGQRGFELEIAHVG
jgi:hypothetical protein